MSGALSYASSPDDALRVLCAGPEELSGVPSEMLGEYDKKNGKKQMRRARAKENTWKKKLPEASSVPTTSVSWEEKRSSFACATCDHVGKWFCRVRNRLVTSATAFLFPGRSSEERCSSDSYLCRKCRIMCFPRKARTWHSPSVGPQSSDRRSLW